MVSQSSGYNLVLAGFFMCSMVRTASASTAVTLKSSLNAVILDT